MGEVIRFPARRPVPVRPPQPTVEPPARTPEPLWREVVGDLLREERRAAGRTLAEVAGEAGISLPYLSEIERGRKEPSSEVLAAVVGALGLRLGDLTVRVSRRLDGPVCLAA